MRIESLAFMPLFYTTNALYPSFLMIKKRGTTITHRVRKTVLVELSCIMEVFHVNLDHTRSFHEQDIWLKRIMIHWPICVTAFFLSNIIMFLYAMHRYSWII